MSDQNKDIKLLLLAGIIAAGVFASAVGSIQLLNANAQQQNSDDPMPRGPKSHMHRDVGLAWLELPLVPPR